MTDFFSPRPATQDQPCPHCATIGGLAHATREALAEIRTLAGTLTQAAAKPAPQPAVNLDARRKGFRTDSLTDREHLVLLGMVDGKSNAEIGRDLYVSEDTIKTHARRMFKKLGARDRAQAVARGYQFGILGGGQ